MSFALYVGKNHTATGEAYLAGYGDEPSSHWLEIVPRRKHPPGSTVTVGATPDAHLPGVPTDIPQAVETARHIRVSYSAFKGLPGPLTNGGLNEHGVAVRDVWSPSRSELVAMTPSTQRGPTYSDLARIVLERARTAAEGVDLIGEMIAVHGESTYGGNSHLIADSSEAWIVIEFAGGQGLWVAERLGADSIRASRPGYIGEIAVDDPAHPDFRYSPNLVSFAVSHGWYAPGSPFDVNAVYGDGRSRWTGVRWIEGELAGRSGKGGKLSLADVMWAIRTPELTSDSAGYGQVVPLIGPGHPQLRVVWHAHVGAIAAPFVPVFMGVETVPEEYRQHRYLTAGEAHRFAHPNPLGEDDPESVSIVPQGIESTKSAVAIFKRLLYLALQHQDPFLDEVQRVWEAVERELIDSHSQAARVAEILLEAGEQHLAGRHLTYYTNTELRRTLGLAVALADGLEARTRALHGFSSDPTPRGLDQIW